MASLFSGLFSSPKPPSAPDPAQTFAAQTRSNIDTARANARLNRVNQQTPWGSITYEEGPVDANGVPTYTSRIQLSPEQQALLTQQQGQQYLRGNMANQFLQSGNIRPLDFSRLHAMGYDRGSGSYGGAVNQLPAPTPVPMPQFPQQPTTGGSSGTGGSGGASTMTAQQIQAQIAQLQALLAQMQGGQQAPAPQGMAPMGGAGGQPGQIGLPGLSPSFISGSQPVMGRN